MVLGALLWCVTLGSLAVSPLSTAKILSMFFCFPSLLLILTGEIGFGWLLTVGSVLVSLYFFLKGSSFFCATLFVVVAVSYGAQTAVHLVRKCLTRLDLAFEALEKEKNLLTDEENEETVRSPALKRKFERYTALSRVTHLLSSSLALKEVSHYAVQQAYEVVGKSEGAFLLLAEEGSEELSLISSHLAKDFSAPKLKKGDLFDQWTLRNRRPLLVRDIAKDFRFDPESSEKRPVRSLLITPLTSRERVRGLLRLESSQADVYASDDLRLLSIIGDLVGSSLENALLAQRTEELARVDELTGLYVHRYLQERLQEEFLRAQRNRSPLSLLMIDIDHFKTYNDRYGHIAGDLVLRQVARILKEKSEPGDLVCRYGGEEFLIILPKRTKEKSLQIAQTLRTTIENELFVLRRETTHVTVSVGAATFPEDGMMKEALLQRVDAFLYQAKREGRNRVCG